MQDNFNILVIDDDTNVIDAFELLVEDIEDCSLSTFVSFTQVKNKLPKTEFQLIFVDIVMPEIDGYEVCKILRTMPETNKAYIILMSGDKHQLLDRIRAYKVGAQEFISKPFDLKEVELIILGKIEYYKQTKSYSNKNITKETTNIISLGKFVIDTDKKQIKSGKTELELTSLEYKLLNFLILNSERHLTLDEIIAGTWGSDSESTAENARGLIYRLRMKIETNQKEPLYLLNSKKSSGYIFYPSGALI